MGAMRPESRNALVARTERRQRAREVAARWSDLDALGRHLGVKTGDRVRLWVSRELGRYVEGVVALGPSGDLLVVAETRRVGIKKPHYTGPWILTQRRDLELIRASKR